MNTFEQWQAGQLRDQEALELLCQSLDRLLDNLEPLKETEKVLRGQISEVVEQIGGKVELANFGKLEITGPAIVASYDRQKLDRLVATLVSEHPEIAQRLVECRSESSRAGGLRITRKQ